MDPLAWIFIGIITACVLVFIFDGFAQLIKRIKEIVNDGN